MSTSNTTYIPMYTHEHKETHTYEFGRVTRDLMNKVDAL